MTTENLPAVNTALLPPAQEFQMFQTIARSAKNSGLYGGDENKIFMVLLAARELGVPPMAALNGGIWNINGKIEISARLMNSMIRRAGHTMHITSNKTECTIKGKRADTGEEQTETFTWEQATTAGLTNGNVWKKYPEDMLYARCMSRLARRLFPDVIGMCYVEGEIREAKQQEQQEKQVSMQMAECEDITSPSPTPEVPAPQVETLSKMQIIAMSNELGYLDNETVKRFYKAYGIENVKDLPASEYDRAMTRIQYTIDINNKAPA